MTIINIPHSSTFIPEELLPQYLLDKISLESELLVMTDWYMDEMAPDDTETIQSICADVSRLVCDVERFRDDAEEPMNLVGMGAVYTRTSDGRRLRDITLRTREEILARFYDPYHQKFEAMTRKALLQHGQCLIIDLHSFPSRPLPYEKDQTLARPEICIGTDAFHTPELLVSLAETYFQEHGLDTVRNEPFTGTIVPASLYKRDSRVKSIMIEVRRDLYMDEATGSKKHDFKTVRHQISKFIDELNHQFVI